MFYNLNLNWSVLIVFLALCVVGIWVTYSFLNKNGLYLFCIVASVIALTFGSAIVLDVEISISTVIMPVIYFALLTAFNKFGKDEAKKLFFITLITMATYFVCLFFQAAYLDSAYKTATFLSWSYLGRYLTPIISFAIASALTLLITSKIKVKNLKNFLKLSVFIAIASFIDALLYVVFVFTGEVSFGSMLLITLIKLAISALVSLGLGYFEKFLNREPKQTQELKEEPVKNKQDIPVEEIKTPDDID